MATMSMRDALGDQAAAFEGLSVEQCQAVVDAMILVLYAEGGASDEQADVFSTTLSELPSLSALGNEGRAQLTQRAIDKLTQLDPSAFTAHLASIARALNRPAAAPSLLAIAAAVACVGGELGETRVRLLGLLGTALGVDGDDLAAAVQRLVGN